MTTHLIEFAEFVKNNQSTISANLMEAIGTLFESKNVEKMGANQLKSHKESMLNSMTWSPEIECVTYQTIREFKPHGMDNYKFEVGKDSSITPSGTEKEIPLSDYLKYPNHLYARIDENNLMSTVLNEFKQYVEENVDLGDFKDLRQVSVSDKFMRYIREIPEGLLNNFIIKAESSPLVDESISLKLFDDNKLDTYTIPNNEVIELVEQLISFGENSTNQDFVEIANYLKKFELPKQYDTDNDMFGKSNKEHVVDNYTYRITEFDDESYDYDEMGELLNELIKHSKIFSKFIRDCDITFTEYVEENAYEIKPVKKLRVKNLKSDIYAIASELDSYEVTFNDSCGAHIHIGLNPEYELTITDYCNILINYYDWKNTSDIDWTHRYNQYVESIDWDYNRITDSSINNVILTRFITHYGEINIAPISTGRFNTIEFRLAPGEIWQDYNLVTKYVTEMVNLIINSIGYSKVELDDGYMVEVGKNDDSYIFANFDSDGKYIGKRYVSIKNRDDDLKLKKLALPVSTKQKDNNFHEYSSKLSELKHKVKMLQNKKNRGELSAQESILLNSYLDDIPSLEEKSRRTRKSLEFKYSRN